MLTILAVQKRVHATAHLIADFPSQQVLRDDWEDLIELKANDPQTYRTVDKSTQKHVASIAEWMDYHSLVDCWACIGDWRDVRERYSNGEAEVPALKVR